MQLNIKRKKQPNPKMGRRPKQTFLQRKYTDFQDFQQTHERMYLTNHYRNANQNYNEISPHTSQWPSSKNLQTTNPEEGVEKREPSCTVSGNVN